MISHKSLLHIFYSPDILYENETRSSPTKILSIRANETVTEAIWEEVSSHLQAWIPQASSFTRSSLYGIRVYTSGSILAPHVDRDPLISSAIINVDQRVTEPWPLEVYDHGGRAHNLTLEPGEIILYESHSILHGEILVIRWIILFINTILFI